MMGVHCSVYSKSFPHKHALAVHILLHGHQWEFTCSSCPLMFAMSNSLNIHVKGKHGVGYVCPCGKCFESLVQCIHHQKCSH